MSGAARGEAQALAAALAEALAASLVAGEGRLCRCWRIARADGLVLGFTDHDRDLSFGGMSFSASAGLSAGALAQATGLGADSGAVIGALSDGAVSEADLAAGRWDGARVQGWLVDWAAPEARRAVQFQGEIGEITRAGGAWQAELLGLGTRLNRAGGRAISARCDAVLGDRRCGLDLAAPAFRLETALASVAAPGLLWLAEAATDHADRWFEKGRLSVLSGRAAGLSERIRRDRLSGAGRQVGLWQGLGITPEPGDRVRLEAGCDRRAETCREKFSNVLNFRGFPDLPGAGWLLAGAAAAAQGD